MWTRCLRASSVLISRRGLTQPGIASAIRLQPPRSPHFSSLSGVLDQEIQDETAGYQDTLDTLEDLRGEASSRSMDLQENKGGVELRWGGEANGSAVTVKFHCQDTFTEHADETASVKFNVNISWQEHGRDLSFECVATGGGVVEITEAGAIDIDDYDDSDAYTAPKYDELSPELQNALKSFLNDNYVDNALAGWIVSFAYHKEAEQYGAWLQKIKAIV